MSAVFLNKLSLLVKDPATYRKKIIPYVRYLFQRTRRSMCETLGIDRYSKPYEGHDKLSSFITERNGFFVEVGANDGFCFDPTYYYEKFRGWSGILVEPLAKKNPDLRRNRPKSSIYNFACVSNEHIGDLIPFVDVNFMSVVKGVEHYEEWVASGEKCQQIVSSEILVPARTLGAIIETHFQQHGPSEIDLLVIDTEGYELEVLKGIDISIYKPKYILAEINDKNSLDLVTLHLMPYYSFLAEITPNQDYLFIRNSQ